MERRRLHNQLRRLKGNIRVFCTGPPRPSRGVHPIPWLPPVSSAPVDPLILQPLSLSRSDERRGTLSGAPAGLPAMASPLTECSHQGSGQDEVFEEISMLVSQPWMAIQCASLLMARQAVARPSPWRVGLRGDPQMEGLIPRALRHLFSVAQELSGQGLDWLCGKLRRDLQ